MKDPKDPGVSPLYGDLKGLCPAHFYVGTEDPLLDDIETLSKDWYLGGPHRKTAV